MNADKILFRCSSLHHLMSDGKQITEKQLETISEYQKKEKLTDKQRETLNSLIQKRDNPELPDGAKTHCIDVFVRTKYGRQTELDNKYLKKGNEAEEDSITLYALAHKNMYYKNEERLSNLFICGTPDLGNKKPITQSDHTIDTKTSWDIFTFTRAKYKDIPAANYWQGIGYMALTGAKKHTVAYCLVNTPYHLVNSELWRESYKHPDNNTPSAIELNIIANHVYDKKTFLEYIEHRACFPIDEIGKSIVDGFIEVPLSERIFEFTITRDDKEIGRIYERVKLAREFMNEKLFV